MPALRKRLCIKCLITAFCLAAGLLDAHAQDGPQIYNLNFDVWSKSSGSWNLYRKNAPESEQVWDSANKGLSLLGINGTTPEYKHVAVPGQGKAAVRIESKKVLWAFVAGNLYTGHFLRIVNFSGAEMAFGLPFHERPKALSGYYDYRPANVNYAKEPYLSMKGHPDVGRIEVFLTDWEEPVRVDTTRGSLIHAETDPHVIGRGVMELLEPTDGYVPFTIEIKYRSSKKPSYIVVNAASSRFGEFFTGGSGSILYLDEFRLEY